MGVDIASIGGKPTDSRIGGEKGPITSVGGHPNSTAAQEAEKERLDNARWEAYRHSGEVALVLVATAAAIWGVFIWRQRQQRARGYKGLRNESEIGLAEQGREYDENQLDDLTVRPDGTRRYEIGEDSDSEDDDGKEKLSKPANGTS
jgi:carboxypeptidase D